MYVEIRMIIESSNLQTGRKEAEGIADGENALLLEVEPIAYRGDKADVANSFFGKNE